MDETTTQKQRPHEDCVSAERLRPAANLNTNNNDADADDNGDVVGGVNLSPNSNHAVEQFVESKVINDTISAAGAAHDDDSNGNENQRPSRAWMTAQTTTSAGPNHPGEENDPKGQVQQVPISMATAAMTSREKATTAKVTSQTTATTAVESTTAPKTDLLDAIPSEAILPGEEDLKGQLKLPVSVDAAEVLSMKPSTASGANKATTKATTKEKLTMDDGNNLLEVPPFIPSMENNVKGPVQLPISVDATALPTIKPTEGTAANTATTATTVKPVTEAEVNLLDVIPSKANRPDEEDLKGQLEVPVSMGAAEVLSMKSSTASGASKTTTTAEKSMMHDGKNLLVVTPSIPSMENGMKGPVQLPISVDADVLPITKPTIASPTPVTVNSVTGVQQLSQPAALMAAETHLMGVMASKIMQKSGDVGNGHALDATFGGTTSNNNQDDILVGTAVPPLSLQRQVLVQQPSQPGAFPVDVQGVEHAAAATSLPPPTRNHSSGRAAGGYSNNNSSTDDDMIEVTTARVVEDHDDDAEQLREQLNQLLEETKNNVPAATVVLGEQEQSPSNNNNDQQQRATSGSSKKKTALWRRIILAVVLIVVVVVVVLVLTTTTNTGGQTTSSDDETPDPAALTTTTSPVVLLQPTLQTIRERGYIRCRVETWQRDQGHGLSLDLCRALSAAIFNGDPNRTEYPTVPWGEHWLHLHNTSLDVTTAEATYTMQRDVYEDFSKLQIAFSTPWFYSGTLLAGVPEFVDCADRADTLTGVCRDLVVCSLEASTNNDFIQKHLGGTGIFLVKFSDEMFVELAKGTCNVVCGNGANLHEGRARDAGYTGEYASSGVLHDKEPFAMASRGDDPEWADFTNTLLQALFTAELEQITSENATLFPQTRLFGDDYRDMFRHAIAAVGNWGQIYARSYLVADDASGEPQQRTPVNSLSRRREAVNLNTTATNAGLLFAPPFGDLKFDPDFANQIGPAPVANGTLEKIREQGVLRCGIVPNRPGFANLVNETTWTGMDADLCRCVGFALFNGADKVEFIQLEDEVAGYTALNNDIVNLVAGVPYNLQADIAELTTGQGFSFSPRYFYDDFNKEGEALALVTLQEDGQWSDFVRWILYALFYAEENGWSTADALLMPTVDLFGSDFELMFQIVVLNMGHYGDLYQRNIQEWRPREGSNQLNNLTSPMIDPLPLNMFN